MRHICSKLVFHKIKRYNIFQNDFENFSTNNEIDFKTTKISILYAPNGTGKSSLAKVLGGEENFSLFDATFNGISKEKLFHVIYDQNNRNIIRGKPNEFFLGDNIEKEYMLKEKIDIELKELIEQKIIPKLKEFNITKKSSKLIKLIDNRELKNYIEDISNNKSKGILLKKDIESFRTLIEGITPAHIPEYIDDKFNFLIVDTEKKLSLINQVEKIQNIQKSEKINEIEENSEAVKILEKFSHKKDCIVCDSLDINPSELISKKNFNKKFIYDSLDSSIKELIENIIELSSGDDPFNIKNILLATIQLGDMSKLNELFAEISKYKRIFNDLVSNEVISIFSSSSIFETFKEYQSLRENQVKFGNEDIKFIEVIINEHIEKNITLTRDEDNNIKIMLSKENETISLLETSRDDLGLSSGEQNFISIAFELLKAKIVNKEFIVLDDPISSFDSIYKNKIAFAILKILENKKQILMTHNTDLIKLLHYQQNHCFNLYFFNNSESGENGFIPVSKKELTFLLDNRKLILFFRNEFFEYLKNEKLFLLSMIPFMRGYTNLTNFPPHIICSNCLSRLSSTKKDSILQFSKDIKIIKENINDIQYLKLKTINWNNDYTRLSKVMHGYENEIINISKIYQNIFNFKFQDKLEINAEDILKIDITTIDEIISKEHFPLLNKTLKHTLTYLFLRMKTEIVLFNILDAPPKKNTLLGALIKKAFPKISQEKERIFFTSKKTLLNDFNHFEGNINIFQPAIDISDASLKKEYTDIICRLKELS